MIAVLHDRAPTPLRPLNVTTKRHVCFLILTAKLTGAFYSNDTKRLDNTKTLNKPWAFGECTFLQKNDYTRLLSIRSRYSSDR